jgi:hypothetical protein
MQKYRRILRRRAILSFIEGLVIFLVLLVLMVARNAVPTGRVISYNRAPGYILVQLAELPELAGAKMHTALEWTLYGDGTLIFRSDPGDDLWRAHLSPGAIQHILDVIINQDKFFVTSEQRYGSIIQGSDDNELLLTVDANGQQKEVTLASEPKTRGAIDIQTMHVFAIEEFLLAYHPLHAVYYAPNSDPDGNNGN